MTVMNSSTLIEISRPFLLSFFIDEGLLDYFFWKSKCHQNLRLMEYHPKPSRQFLPNAIAVGILGMMWAMGVSQRMPDKGWDFSWKNSISWHIALLMLHLCFAWWTSLAVHFIANKTCLALSLQVPRKVPFFRDRTMFWNSLNDSSRSLLFSEKACAMDAYKWERRWKINVAPWARCPSFPVSFGRLRL